MNELTAFCRCLLLTLLLTFSTAKAQWVPIADIDFGNFLYSLTLLQPCLRGDSTTGWELDTLHPNVYSYRNGFISGDSINDISEVRYFKNLESIGMTNMQLGYLPPMPPQLKWLRCNDCMLTGYAPLPNGILHLELNDNLLTSLPQLPSDLKVLLCSKNQITMLPALSDSIHTLDCSFNPLTGLPVLADSFWSLNVDGTLMPCLPPFKHLQYLTFDTSVLACVPNYNIVYFTPAGFPLPLCELFNANGCPAFWNISGKAYHDMDASCTSNTADRAATNVKVQLYKGNALVQQVFTGSHGYYSFEVHDTGAYSVLIDTAMYKMSCASPGVFTTNIVHPDSMVDNLNFGIECALSYDVAAWSVTPLDIFFPGRTTHVLLHAGDWADFLGMNCHTNNLGGNLSIRFDGPVSFVSVPAGALVPAVSGNRLTYTISDWAEVNPHSDFLFTLRTDTFAQLGDSVCFSVFAAPNGSDHNPVNNALSNCFIVVNSYDPNDKQVSPIGDIQKTQDWLTYTIRFQNTGTAPAFHIYVDDTLDTDLDETSFELLAYSHQPLVQVKQNMVRFNFPNINLADSTHDEPNSHGYVQYKIRMRENLPAGTAIENTAAIYFDFNPPVITNTVMNTVARTYFPFPITNARWEEVHSTKEFGTSYSVHRVIGDTVTRNGHTYTKVYVGHTGGARMGGIREEAKRIYFARLGHDEVSWEPCVPDSLDEMLLYDFSLDSGETFTLFDTALYPMYCYAPGTVTAVDSVEVFGEYRRRLHVTGGRLLTNDVWIEGVGSTAGLFGPYSSEFENNFSLCAFVQEQEVFYPYNQGCSVGIAEREAARKLVIYPNPSSGKIEIASPPQHIASIELLNMSGRVVAQFADARSMSVENVQQGVYFLRLTDKAQQQYYGKVVCLGMANDR